MSGISTGRIGAVGAVAPTGGGGPASGALRGALGRIAGSVTGRIAGALNLVSDEDGHGGTGSGSDPYGIDAIAAQLASALSASPAEAGELTRLLHAYAAEIAARMGAVPDARCVAEIAAIADRAADAPDAPSAIRAIGEALLALAR